jgi:hypothetical protein
MTGILLRMFVTALLVIFLMSVVMPSHSIQDYSEVIGQSLEIHLLNISLLRKKQLNCTNLFTLIRVLRNLISMNTQVKKLQLLMLMNL